ncbi:MAG: NAD(P)H-binding protein [Rhodospirillaceae bacterium]|nr:NAD(P)H-binding protein [Rhodospirillaceae bacterium]
MLKVLCRALALLLLATPAFAKDGVIVFGGTGRLGSDIVKLLVQAGEDVTVFTRKDDNRDRLTGLKVRYAIGDVLDEASIGKAFSSHKFRVAIDASAQRGEVKAPDFYERVARAIVTHGKRTGVNQIILHGSIGAGENIKIVPALASYKQTPALVDKGKAEKLIADGGVPYTIIRNGVIPNNEPLPPATHKAGLTVDETTFSAVTRADLAILTLDVMDNPARLNRIYHAIDATLAMPKE